MPATSGDLGHTGVAPPAPASPLRWRNVFPGEQRQMAVLRRWLNSLLPDCAARSDVVCVATELGTNAVLHTASGRDGWFAVEITWYGSVVRVAVADCGGAGEPHQVTDADGEHGRGLAVVSRLAVQAGFHGDRHGRLVWADIPWDMPRPQIPVQVAHSQRARQPAADGYWHGQPAFLSA